MNTEIATYSYFRQRQRNRIYEKVVKALREEATSRSVKRKDIAAKLDKKPSQISRWLSGPSNWSIDTVSDLLFAIDCELDFEVVPFKNRCLANEFHILNFEPPPSESTISPSGATEAASFHLVVNPA
jgi:transcriptional regulator with XRE-family HTH domain